jgi:hypothetical protein
MNDLKNWSDTWQRAGVELDKIRRREIRNADTQKAILIMSDAFEAALRTMPRRTTSGLVEQQKLFRRLHR